ncbi:uncharacterized protein [Hyperolius riggenbachi]|uniref:uncharacterized protein n=1 Tax=Hyperolius riggenbachi TaxID=752182 RepID=UPI0035A2FCF4
MGRISALSVLLFLSGTLLSDHYANGQTTQISGTEIFTWTMEMSTEIGAVITDSNTCTSYAEAGASLCSNYTGIEDLNVLLRSGNTFSYCDHSLQEYGCASAVKDASVETLTSILSCFLTGPSTTTTNEGFASFFAQFPIDKLSALFNAINNQFASSSITPLNKEYILTAAVEALIKDPVNLLPGTLATWFQEKLYLVIPAINSNILGCLATTSITCDGLAAIVSALDLQFSVFNNDTKVYIGMWITKFIGSHSCGAGAADVAQVITKYYKSFSVVVGIEDYKIAFGTEVVTTVLPSLSSEQMLQYVQTNNVFTSYESSTAVLNILENQDFNYNYAILSSLSDDGYDNDVLFTMLSNILVKLNSISDPTCKPKVNVIFSKLDYLFKAVNETILELYQPQDCSDFQAFYNAVDSANDNLSEDVRKAVYQGRLKFLNAEAQRSGSGCTYGFNSVTWLQQNWGLSVEYVAYSEFISLFSAFDGYEACEYLNTNQILDMLIQTGILTEASPANYTYRITAVTKVLSKRGFTELKLFLIQFRTILIKYEIRIIFNFQVRYLFLQGIWQTVKTEFSSFTSNDWYSWMHEYLVVFSSAFSAEELSDLSINVVHDCSNLQTITSGLSMGYGDMGDGTKSDCTDWVARTINDTQNHCTDLVADWLQVNFYNFSQNINIVVIKELNPNYEFDVTVLTTTQLGQLVVVSEEARTNVTYVAEIFSNIIDTESVEQSISNLAFFWDSYNVEITTSVNISNDVKYFMLQQTCSQLAEVIVNFTAQETSLWFENRLTTVMSTIDNTILQSDIPVTVDCSVQKVFVNAFSKCYDETLESNRKDVTAHLEEYMQQDTQHKTEVNQCIDKEESTLTYIQDYIGEYVSEFSYEVLESYFIKFNVFETGVLVLLTVNQIGDMVVVDKIYESDEESTKFITYLSSNSTSVDTADAIMERFCETGTQKNVEIKESSGKIILGGYLNKIKSSIQTYTKTEIRYIFKYKIILIVQYFTYETLSLFVVEDCDTLAVMVSELNKAYNKMTGDTKTQVVRWILTMLRKSSLNGCTTTSTNSVEYITINFQQFFQDTTISEVIQVNSNINVLDVIEYTSVSQKVEYLVSSTVLTSVNQTVTVLESLKAEVNVSLSQQVDTFLTEFNTAYTQSTEKSMTDEVRQAGMDILFTYYTSNINTLTTEEVSSFSQSFQYFISGFTVNLTQEIPLDMNCHAYNKIFSGIESVSSDLTDDTNAAVFDRAISYLNQNHHGSSDVCSELYTDSRTYLQQVFVGMSSYANITQFQEYYSNFSAYQCLDLFTGTQLGSLIITTTAISNVMEAAQILLEVKKRSTEDVFDFVVEIHQVSIEENIQQIDSSVQTLICQSVLTKVIEDVKETGNYTRWFDGNLDLLVSGFTASDIESIPVKKDDCNSQQNVVKSFSQSYEHLNDDQRGAMINRIKDFNEGYKKDTGHACPTPSDNSSAAWVESTYGKFSQNFSIQDFKLVNDDFKADEILKICTGFQLADVAILNGALKTEEALVVILENVDTTEKLSDFLDQCNSQSPEDLKNGPAAQVICSKTFEILEVDTLSDIEVKDWFQNKLVNVLHQVNSTDLDNVNFPLRCSAYKEMVAGFNNVYDDMTEDTRKTVYDHCIHRQLTSIPDTNGVKCGKLTDNPQVWLQDYIGSFSKDGNVTDFSLWNPSVQLVEVLTNLNPSQVAEVIVASINNEETACQVAAKVQQYDSTSVSEFLDSFSSTLKMQNVQVTSVVISSKILAASISALSSSLSQLSSTDWDTLLKVQLYPLFLGLNADDMSTLLENADCSAFSTLNSQLNNVFDKYSEDTKNSLFNSVNAFVTKHQTSTGFCLQGGAESSEATINKFGRFAPYFTVAQFKSMNPSFSGMSALSSLSSAQVATVCFDENAIFDQSKATQVTSIMSSYTFTQLDGFLRAFKSNADTNKLVSLPDATIASSFFTTIFNIVSSQFATFTDSQWSDYFGVLLTPFLPALNVEQIQKLPLSMSCSSFAFVVAGCNKYYERYPGDVQRAFFERIKAFLTSKQTSTGSPCVGNLKSAMWLDSYMGYFSEQASTDEISAIYAQFSFVESINYLTPIQLGAYMASATVLTNAETVTKIMTSLNSQNIGEFMNSFNAEAEKNGITEINSADVRKVIITEIFCKYGTAFSSWMASDYSYLFTHTLRLVRTSLSTKAFSFLPSGLSCNAISSIMAPLISNSDGIDTKPVYDFVYTQLSQQLQQPGGSACTKGYDSRTWVLTFFGGATYFQDALWSEIIILDPNFDVSSCADFMTSVQISASTSSVTVTRNVTTVVTILQTISGDLSNLAAFLDQLKAAIAVDPLLASNGKVFEAITEAVATYVFVTYDTLSPAEITAWMNRASVLYAYLNATYLEFIPLDVSCEQLQAVCGGLQKAKSSLSQGKQQGVSNFILGYLKYKYDNDGAACTSNSQSVGIWISNYLGGYCSLITFDKMNSIYPTLDTVSYGVMCP